jgi:hypothetical protein
VTNLLKILEHLEAYIAELRGDERNRERKLAERQQAMEEAKSIFALLPV